MLLERILKSTGTSGSSSKDTSNDRRSFKRPHAEISPTDTKPSIDSTSESTNGAPIKSEPQTPTTKMQDLSMSELHDDDLDFSMLDDEENQFSEVDVTHSAATSKPGESSADKAKQIKEELVKKENETYAKLLSNWENDSSINGNDADDELLGSVDFDSLQAMTVSNADGNSALKFWYWDAYEDPIKLPGKLFLFGKMVSDENRNEYKSVCVTVENVNRCLYVLPRKYVSKFEIFKPQNIEGINSLSMGKTFRSWTR